MKHLQPRHNTTQAEAVRLRSATQSWLPGVSIVQQRRVQQFRAPADGIHQPVGVVVVENVHKSPPHPWRPLNQALAEVVVGHSSESNCSYPFSSLRFRIIRFSNLQDSSVDVCLEDCYISTGNALIAIKSGWDEYGILFDRPSTNNIIHRLIRQTRSAGIAIGSKVSGGVSEVRAEDIHIFYSHSAVRIKTSGRVGYDRNVYISNFTLANVDIAIRFTGLYGEHPDDDYDPDALPVIGRITMKDVIGENVKHAGLIHLPIKHHP